MFQLRKCPFLSHLCTVFIPPVHGFYPTCARYFRHLPHGAPLPLGLYVVPSSHQLSIT